MVLLVVMLSEPFPPSPLCFPFSLHLRSTLCKLSHTWSCRLPCYVYVFVGRSTTPSTTTSTRTPGRSNLHPARPSGGSSSGDFFALLPCRSATRGFLIQSRLLEHVRDGDATFPQETRFACSSCKIVLISDQKEHSRNNFTTKSYAEQ